MTRTYLFLFLSLIFIISFFFKDPYSTLHSTIIFLFLFIISTLKLAKLKHEIRTILFVAFILRFSAALISYYGIFYLEGAGKGGDAFYFIEEAYSLVNSGISNLIINFSEYSSNIYSVLIAIMFYFFGPSNALPISLNIILGVLIIVRIFQTTNLLFNKKAAKIVALFAAVNPWLIIFSATILREAIITFCIISSIYFYVKYYKYLKLKYAGNSVLYIFSAALFHGGIIFIAFAIIFFILYKTLFTKGKFTLSSLYTRIITFLVTLILIFSFTLSIYLGNLNIYKLRVQNSSAAQVTEYLQNKSGYAKETSKKRYRDRLYINSPSDYFVAIPEVTIPFFFKPYLWDLLKWRYPIHYFHSLLMIYLFVLLFINYRKIVKSRLLLHLLFIFFLNSFVFSFGTAQINASIRHNYKVVPILICILAPAISKNFTFTKSSFS